MKEASLETLLIQYQEQAEGPVVPPIYQTSNFQFKDWESIDRAFDDPVNTAIYARGKNPSVAMIEEKIALICGGEKAKFFSSGMAAISSAILHCVQSGDHVIAVKNIYGPANNFLNVYLREKFNIDTTFIEGKDLDEFRNSIRKNTKLIYLESPSTAVFALQDIEGVAKIAREHAIKTIIDNSCATPVFQQPLLLGIDLEVHSCSKYINGHSDVVAGVIIGKEGDIHSISLREFPWFGAKLAPFEAWLILRGLRTLRLRMTQHQHNAMKIAEFLSQHPKVTKVTYTGLATFPQKELANKQMKGHSGLLSFQLSTTNLEQIKNFFNSLQYFRIAISWGGYESLVYAPAISYLKELPAEQFEALGISLGDIRISVGLEDADDLIHDLNEALKHIL